MIEMMMAEAHLRDLRRQGDKERQARRALWAAEVQAQIRNSVPGALRAIARAFRPAPAAPSAN